MCGFNFTSQHQPGVEEVHYPPIRRIRIFQRTSFAMLSNPVRPLHSALCVKLGLPLLSLLSREFFGGGFLAGGLHWAGSLFPNRLAASARKGCRTKFSGRLA